MRHGRLSSPSTWVAGGAAACLAGALALSMSPAHAAPTSVTGTFGATGVTSSACSTEIGGNALYVKPGNALKAKTSLLGVSILGLSLPPGVTPTALTGTLLVKHGMHSVFNHLIGATSANVATLPAGTFPYKFTAKSLNFKGPLGLPGSIAVSFTWSGNVYSTTKKDPCGITISTPTVHVSASVPVLPPINVTLPGVSLPTLPNPLNSVSLPNIPIPGQSSSHAGGKTGGHKGGTAPSGTVSYTPPALTVPEEVMPNANAVGGSGGFAAPDAGGGYGAPIVAPAQPASGGGGGGGSAASPQTTPAKKTVDLSSRDQLGGQQLPVLLAILAILALVSVTGMYARLYLLRRPTK